MASGQVKDTNARMSFIISKELKAKLEAYAEAEDRSTSKIIAYAVKEYLENHAPDTSQSQADDHPDGSL